ncbi:hypothetical protein SAMD00079811_35510 [Scytonema sp. HK-05]|nr:hypothetical protein SAMD00079811_35510 [Scytonema sp. HK-05]
MSKQVYSSSAAFLTSHLNIDVSEAEPLRFGKRYLAIRLTEYVTDTHLYKITFLCIDVYRNRVTVSSPNPDSRNSVSICLTAKDAGKFTADC